MVKCNHPNHRLNFKKSLEELPKYAGRIVGEPGKPETDIYVETKKFGKICLNCFCYEMGENTEEYPFHNVRE